MHLEKSFNLYLINIFSVKTMNIIMRTINVTDRFHENLITSDEKRYLFQADLGSREGGRCKSILPFNRVKLYEKKNIIKSNIFVVKFDRAVFWF